MSRDFPGANSNYLTVADGGSLDITGTAITVACWINPDTVSSVSFIGKWAASNYQYVLGISAAKLYIGTGSGGSVAFTNGATVISSGAWTHVAGRMSGASSAQVFLSGAQDASGSAVGSIGNGSSPFRIGNTGDNTNPFDGKIAEASVWNVALSAAEIAALAKGQSPLCVRPQNLAAYYPLWGVGAAGEPDLSGNGKHLTETGTVGVANHAPVGPYVLL